MERPVEQQLSDLYISNIDIIEEGFPVSVNSSRSGYMENFLLLGLPTKKNENYRRCDLREMFAREWEHFFTPQPLNLIQYAGECDANGYQISLLNGFCKEGSLTELDNGVIYGSLKEAIIRYPDLINAYYNKTADNETTAVTSLNSAFIQDGGFLYVPDGVKTDYPFVINYNYATDELSQMCFSRALIILGEKSSADIIITHNSADGKRFLVDFVSEVFIMDEAEVGLNESSRLNADTTFINNQYIKQSKGSRMNSLNVWFEGGTTRVNKLVDLESSAIESNVYGLYFGVESELIDVHVNMNHLDPDCNSFQLIKGIVSGNATGSFNGKVYVAKDAQRTMALQESRNLQLSDTAKIYTEPQLEIYADDVKCSHGATVGQMDEEAVYYMRQRGISEEDARKLQLSGFVNDILARCSISSFCDYLHKIADQKISSL